MKYLITGGAGFLGINMARYLLAKGQEVVILDKEPFEYPEADKVSHFIGDICDQKTVSHAMQNIDIVIHTAAALPLYTEEEIMTTDVGGTELLLEEAQKHHVKRFIHISSTAVYGIPDHHPLVETDTLDGVGPYGKAKIMAEKLCEKARTQGMVVPVLRPKSFVGPERLGVFALFYDWAKDGKNFPMIGNGKNRYQLLAVEDLCDAIYLAATEPAERANDTFNIGAAEYLTMREDYQAVLDRAGFGKKIIGLPATPIIWILRILEALKLSPLYKWVYETASKDSFVSIEKAKKQLGYAPKFSNAQALIENYDWYLANLSKFEHTSGVTHRVPWKQGILKVAKIFF